MNRRTFLSACAGALAARGAEAAKLNFVFLLFDDMGWADVGYQGSDFYETPNIDRLAKQGMRFSQAYAACPVCSPTRASIMTGKYPARLHLTNFLPGRQGRRYAKMMAPEFQQQLPLEEVTIAEALGAGGYSSGSIGKWHLGGQAAYFPDKQGFGTSFVTEGPHLSPRWTVKPPYQPRQGEDRVDRMVEEGEKFLESNQARPFFLYLPFHLPHIPLEAREPLIAKYTAKLNSPKFRARKDVQTPSQNNPAYAAMMENADTAVGRILKKLDDFKLSGKTVVVFTSDNGGLSAPEFQRRPATSNAPLREGKGHCYEGGIRVPMVVRWPGVVKAGAKCDVPVCSIDYHPTILEMAGLKGSEGYKPDGVSILPLLKNQGRPRRDTLFWHYPHYSNQGGTPAGAVRQGNYKLIEFYDDNHVELYDIAKDIGERDDLARKMPDKASKLRAMLHEWRQSVSADMPEPNPAYDPKREMEGLAWHSPQ
jgi:arylsulfatase A-like enzyme